MSDNVEEMNEEKELLEIVKRRSIEREKQNESNITKTDENMTISRPITPREIKVDTEIPVTITEKPTVTEEEKDILAVGYDIKVDTNIEEEVEIENSEESVSNTDRFSLDNISPEEEVDVIGDDGSDETDNVTKESITSTPIKIGSTGDRKSIKRISNLNPGKNIKVMESDEYQRAVIEQYITRTKGESFIGPKSVTRVILPYSGIYYDISSYTNSDMLGIHRSTTDITFVEKIEKELYSAWEHTVNNSFKRKLEFSEWLRNIKYPDIWCIYWGIYNVNHPGINTYTSSCDHCPNSIEEKRDNYNISYVSDSSIDDIGQDEIDKIRNGVDREFIKSYKIASTIIEKEDYLPDQKFKVFQGMPNMEDVLTFLKYLKVDLDEDDDIIRRVLYPISWLELERRTITKSTISKILSYKYSMFTRKIYVPVYEEVVNMSKEPGSKPKIKATYVDVKPIMIPPLIDSLSKDDFRELVKGKELRKIMMKDGIHFRIKDSVCPKCGKSQLTTALDMRDILFTRAEALTDFLITI